jgi:16S rRNA processing protein RimM
MERTAASTSSTDPRYVALGRVVAAHGVSGQLRVRYFGDGPEELLRHDRVVVGRSEADPEAAEFEVVRAVPGRRGEVRIGLVGVEDREAAERLRGRLLMTGPEALEPLRSGEYYGYQLLGCRVEGHDGRAIGVVRGIWPIGENDVLVVEGEGGTEHLIPAVRDLLREVDVEGRRIVVDVIPGLLESA